MHVLKWFYSAGDVLAAFPDLPVTVTPAMVVSPATAKRRDVATLLSPISGTVFIACNNAVIAMQ